MTEADSDLRRWSALAIRHRCGEVYALLAGAAAAGRLDPDTVFALGLDATLHGHGALWVAPLRAAIGALPAESTRPRLLDAISDAPDEHTRLSAARFLVHVALGCGGPLPHEQEALVWWLLHEPNLKNVQWARAVLTDLGYRFTTGPGDASGTAAPSGVQHGGKARKRWLAATAALAALASWPLGSRPDQVGARPPAAATAPTTDALPSSSVAASWGALTPVQQRAGEQKLRTLDRRSVASVNVHTGVTDGYTRLVSTGNARWRWRAEPASDVAGAAMAKLRDGLADGEPYQWRTSSDSRGWHVVARPVALGATRAGIAPNATLVFGGDVMFDGRVRPALRWSGQDWPWAAISRLMSDADGAVLNLECPLTGELFPTPLKRPEELAVGREFIFSGPPEAATAMAKAGVVAVSLANNHAMDHGPQGLAATRTALGVASVAAAGAGGSWSEAAAPAVLRLKRLTVALLSFCAADTLPRADRFGATEAATGVALLWPDDAGRLTPASRHQLVSALRRAQGCADVVIVQLHAGIEGSEYPSVFQGEVARTAILAGADAFVGHHSHCIQPVEWLHGRPIIHSVGNLVFSGATGAKLEQSALARLRMSTDGVIAVEFAPLRLVNCRPEPTADERCVAALAERLAPATGIHYLAP